MISSIQPGLSQLPRLLREYAKTWDGYCHELITL